MKQVFLTAFSLLLLSNCPVYADNERSAAGQATPVKLGGKDGTMAHETKVKVAKQAKAAAEKAAREAAIKGARAANGAAGSGAASNSAASSATTSGGAATARAAGQAVPKVIYGTGKPRTNLPTGSSASGVTQPVGVSGSAAPASSNAQLPAGFSEPGRKTAFGGKGLIPPPPTAFRLSPPPMPGAASKRRGGKGKLVVEKLVTVGSGGPYHLLGHQRKEEFAQTFTWQPDSLNDTLTFKAKFTPIGTIGLHFNWIRVMLGNQVIADERSLSHKSDLTLDLTGKVERGINQIVVDGQGSAGASFEWKLTTPKKCKLTSLDPDEVVVGQDLTLKGEGFDPNPANDIVTIGNKNLIPSAATATQLKVRIPKDFPPDEYKVHVTVDGLASHDLKVTIRGIPELTATNLQGVPPGAPLVIYGKNFSKKMSENHVMFDGTAATVTSSTTETITVVVPEFSTEIQGDTGHLSGQVGIPIRVKVGKVDAINTVPINVGNSMWQDPGLKGGPDAPQVPVDWRRLLEN